MTSHAEPAAPPSSHAAAALPAQPLPSATRVLGQERYGGPEVLRLEERPLPTPGPGEVLLEVHAAGLDRGTLHLLRGTPYVVRAIFGLRRPRQAVGLDVAGRVVALGPGVTRFALGDAVFGIARGSCADYALASVETLALKPAEVDFAAAAAASVSGVTALQALRLGGPLRPGQRVLVLGASGGVGSFAVQLARAAGAEVTGAASAAKLDFVRGLGAQRALDYRDPAVLAGGERYERVLAIGGAASARQLRRALTPQGSLVVVGGEPSDRWLGLGRQLGTLALAPWVSQRLRVLFSEERACWIEELAEHLASGRVTTAIGGRCGLAEVPAALRRLEAGEVRGKLVVEIRA